MRKEEIIPMTQDDKWDFKQSQNDLNLDFQFERPDYSHFHYTLSLAPCVDFEMCDILTS